MKLNLLIVLFVFTLTNKIVSQNEFNICFLVYDKTYNKENLIQLAENLYNKDKIKFNNLTIYHFNKENKKEIISLSKKSKIEYIERKTDCKFSFCDNLDSYVSLQSKERNKFFFNGPEFLCNTEQLNMEFSKIPSRDNSFISQKIKEEIIINKSLKQNTCLFFCFIDGKLNNQFYVNFESDTIKLNADEEFQIKPKYSNTVSKVSWEPKEKFNVPTDFYPVVKTDKSAQISLTISDSSNCKSFTKNIYLQIKNDCKCGKNLEPLIDIFKENKFKKYKKPEANYRYNYNYDYKLPSTNSGTYVYDLIMYKNCASKFYLSIEDKNGKIVKAPETYFRYDIDERSKNYFHKDFPNYFIFHLTLNDLSEIMDDGENSNKIIIISVDDEGKECSKYVSPRLTFVGCE